MLKVKICKTKCVPMCQVNSPFVPPLAAHLGSTGLCQLPSERPESKLPYSRKPPWHIFKLILMTPIGFPRWCGGKEPACQCRRFRRGRFNPWVKKISWSRKQQPTPVFLPTKFHGQRSLVGYSPWGCRVRNDWVTEHAHTQWLFCSFMISHCMFNLHSITFALVDFTVPNTFSSVLSSPSLDHKAPKCKDLASFIPSRRPNNSTANICWMDKGLNGWKVPIKY